MIYLFNTRIVLQSEVHGLVQAQGLGTRRGTPQRRTQHCETASPQGHLPFPSAALLKST